MSGDTEQLTSISAPDPLKEELSPSEALDEALEPQYIGELPGSIARRIDIHKRMAVGMKCKRLVDWGRLQHLRFIGMDAEIVRYVGPDITGESHLLLAKRRSES